MRPPSYLYPVMLLYHAIVRRVSQTEHRLHDTSRCIVDFHQCQATVHEKHRRLDKRAMLHVPRFFLLIRKII